MAKSSGTLGDELRRLRTDAGVGLRMMARRVGVSAPHLSNIERGCRRPSGIVLRRVARLLRPVGANYEDLAELNKRVDPAMRRWADDTPGVAQLLETLSDLPQQDKKLLPHVLQALEALAEEARVMRRFERLGRIGGIEVARAFAPYPARITAAMRSAHGRARRVLAVFQPHGYGPTRFLWEDLVEKLSSSLKPEDRLWMLEVFSPGGRARGDFSAAAIASDVSRAGTAVEFVPFREELVGLISKEARKGDVVLVMGGLDPSLRELARSILHALGREGE